MGREKRKGLLENSGGIYEKKTKKDETAAVAEEPTDEEVEEFYLILRRMKQAAEYFGVEKGMLTKSLSAVVAAVADREVEEEEEEEEEEKGLGTAAPAPAEVKRLGKGEEVVEENGLRLDLNIAVGIQNDGR